MKRENILAGNGCSSSNFGIITSQKFISNRFLAPNVYKIFLKFISSDFDNYDGWTISNGIPGLMDMEGNTLKRTKVRIPAQLIATNLNGPKGYGFFFKYGPIPASFSFIFVLFTKQFNCKLKKHRWCAWDSNTWPQNGRRRRNHRDMAADLGFAFLI